MSDLDDKLLAAVEAISTGSFGEDLRRYHPGRRDGRERFSWLSGMELNHPPPIQRTVRILYTARMTGFDLNLSDEDKAYLAWVTRAIRFVEALVDLWWGPINPDVRTLFIDGDDAPALVLLNTMFSGSRVLRPASMRSTASGLGIGNRELAALSAASRSARQTEIYRRATGVDQQIHRNQALRRELVAIRRQTEPELAVRAGSALDKERVRIRAVLSTAYTSANDSTRRAADVLRGYNQLVTASISFILASCEERSPAPIVTLEPAFPITIEVDERLFRVHVTTDSPNFASWGATFRIADDGPLDGLYLDEGGGVHSSGDRTIVDRIGSRLSELEAAPRFDSTVPLGSP